MTERLSSTTDLSNDPTVAADASSRLAVGSSARMRLGRVANARAREAYARLTPPGSCF